MEKGLENTQNLAEFKNGGEKKTMSIPAGGIDFSGCKPEPDTGFYTDFLLKYSVFCFDVCKNQRRCSISMVIMMY